MSRLQMIPRIQFPSRPVARRVECLWLCNLSHHLISHLGLLGLLLFGLVTPVPAQERVSFNRDIRPILSDRCFICHGPDALAREADLRFDQEDSAKSPRGGGPHAAIVPGDPESSEMLVRMLESDPDLQMPPPDSNLSVSDREIQLVKRWIEEGAAWEKHWSLIAPSPPEVPSVSDASWPVNSIDQFILKRLESSGLKPSRPATREHWLRRVSFDLTGLPPTIEQMDEFLADNASDARAKVVDRLLKSVAYGERMALEWLDVSRYGDTDGLFEDHPRDIYPWRDWVIEAFNSNLPYSDFIKWQLAGDLLPEPTIDQRVATGFLRHNPTSNEGGIIDEDYRVKYLVDRVNTTATAMMGLTLECAQCHDHKYDPMTQREYYQFAGFFNSLVGNGNTKGAAAPTLRRYDTEQSKRILKISELLSKLDTELKSTPKALSTEFDQWVAELEEPVRWIDPAIEVNKDFDQSKGWLVAKSVKPKSEEVNSDRPTMKGRYVRLEMPKDHDGFLTISEVQVFSAGVNIARTGKATQSSIGYNSPASKAIDGNHNGSFASCSCTNSERNAWWEIDLGDEFPIDSVAVWNRTDCCPERLDHLSIQVLDEKRQASGNRTIHQAEPRNALPIDAMDTESEARTFIIDLILADAYQASERLSALQVESQSPLVAELAGLELIADKDGSQSKEVPFHGDKNLKFMGEPLVIGLESPVSVKGVYALRVKLSTNDFKGLRFKTTTNSTAALRGSLPKDRNARLNHFREQWSGFSDLRIQKQGLLEERKAIDAQAPLTMIASDMSSPRENYLLKRGEYDNRGEIIPTAAPASVMAFSDDLPRTRLGLAKWLVDSKHPLTARVAVNRYWQMLFGRGIVKTSEDFGTQGATPSHQDLLDFLAIDFMESGWDVKHLLKKIVLSATYGQASHQSLDLHGMDPENALLSRGSRRRLPAEFVRDHALSISGLLTQRLGGPGVHPYQPAELFGPNAIGSSRAKFTQSSGADLYRRSLYTYWKRQIPAANMRILGADGRTTCRTRRERTNTPLQALVLLNDPQFVEAARAFAERIVNEGGESPEDRLRFGFRLATSRSIDEAELSILAGEYQDRLKEFRADQERAKSYLAGGGEHQPDGKINVSELAAYAAVCSLIINLDETITTN